MKHSFWDQGILYANTGPRGIQVRAAAAHDWARYRRSLVSQMTMLLAIGAMGMVAQVVA